MPATRSMTEAERRAWRELAEAARRLREAQQQAAKEPDQQADSNGGETSDSE